MSKKDMPSGIKLSILEHVATKPSSATEVAKKLKISLPYALNLLTLLEAQEFVKSEAKADGIHIGKPKKIYSLKEELIEITLLGEGFGKRFASNIIDPQLRTYFQFLSFVSDLNKVNFSEYYWKHNQYLKHVHAIGMIKNESEGAEFVAITTAEHLTNLRQNISNYKTEKGFTIACWVHTEEEFIEGLKRNDDYYKRLMKKAIPMLDNRGVFERLGEYNK
ncbi:hypothetical protein JXA48_04365 [Candidatus Woesearchaeota archaeon]|nr:hypothetical protein [Candidatus Woesearchaeota archaeon]